MLFSELLKKADIVFQGLFEIVPAKDILEIVQTHKALDLPFVNDGAQAVDQSFQEGIIHKKQGKNQDRRHECGDFQVLFHPGPKAATEGTLFLRLECCLHWEISPFARNSVVREKRKPFK